MIGVEAIVDAAAAVWRVPRERIQSRSRAPRVLKAKRDAIFLADRHSGHGVEALARRFRVSSATVYNSVRRVACEVERERAFNLDAVEASARAIDEAEKQRADKPLADAAEVAHRIVVEGGSASEDELSALAHAVLRSTPVRHNPLVTDLVVAAGAILAKDGPSERRALLAALTTLTDCLEAECAP